MTVTAKILKDITEKNGRRRVWIEYTHVETGTKHHAGVARIQPGDDAQAYANGKCAKIQKNLELNDLGEIEYLVEKKGGDIDAFRPLAITKEKAARHVVKRFFNNVKRAAKNDPEALIKIKKAAQTINQRFTNKQIASIMGWQVAEVASAKNKVQSYLIAAGDIDHGKDEVEERV